MKTFKCKKCGAQMKEVKTKRFETAKWYHQFFIIPSIGIKRFYTEHNTKENIALVFAWLNRGFHIVIFTKKA